MRSCVARCGEWGCGPILIVLGCDLTLEAFCRASRNHSSERRLFVRSFVILIRVAGMMCDLDRSCSSSSSEAAICPTRTWS